MEEFFWLIYLRNFVNVQKCVAYTQQTFKDGLWCFSVFFSEQEDEDGHLVVLGIIQDLMLKAQEIFLDHFARLGIFSKVQALAGPPEAQDSNDENEQPSDQGRSCYLSDEIFLLSNYILFLFNAANNYSRMLPSVFFCLLTILLIDVL